MGPGAAFQIWNNWDLFGIVEIFWIILDFLLLSMQPTVYFKDDEDYKCIINCHTGHMDQYGPK
jgi:hypothetical protein